MFNPIKKLNKKDLDIDINTLFYDKEERKEAKQLLGKYLREYSIESIADKNTLSQLIFLELFNKRLQKQLNDLQEQKEIPSIKLIESLHRNLEKIVLLKNTLGITKEKDYSQKSDTYKSLELLKKKFKIWRNENQGSRQMLCPHCQQMILMKIRTDIWEAQQHPFFKDRILGNETLIKLYKQDRISKKELADILECSTDYIDWLIEKWNKIPEALNTNTIQVVIPA